MSDTSFGLEIDEHVTRICDLRPNGKKIELQAVASYDTAANFFETDNQLILDKQVETIKRLYANSRISKKKVNIVIPDGRTFSQIVEMPILKEKELVAVIRYQADEFIPMNIDETYLDIEILHEDTQKKKLQVLIVAAARTLVNQIYTTIERAGLTPDALENQLSAACRLYTEVVRVPNQTYIVVNIGYSGTSLYCIDGSTGTATLIRTVKIGLELFMKDLKINLNQDETRILEMLAKIGLGKDQQINLGQIMLPLVKELMGEIQQFITLAQQTSGRKIVQIITYNNDTTIAHLPEYIQAVFHIPVISGGILSSIFPNAVSTPISKDLSQYVSVISANFR